jgi:hypothetical protein
LRKRLTAEQQIGKREKLNMVTWNRRLKKAGEGSRATARGGVPGVPPDPSLEHLQSYRVRKDRSENGYRTRRKSLNAVFSGDEQMPTKFWVQDIRTGERVTDPNILGAVVALVNDRRKWPYKIDEKPSNGSNARRYEAVYKLGAVTFDKPGPEELQRHHLGLDCECINLCRPKAPTRGLSWEENEKRLRAWDEERGLARWSDAH